MGCRVRSNSSDCEMPAVQAQECEFGSPESTCKPGTAVSVCTPALEWDRDKGIPRTYPQSASPNHWVLGSVRDPDSKTKVESRGETHNINLWPFHAHTDIHAPTYTYAQHDLVHTTHIYIPKTCNSAVWYY